MGNNVANISLVAGVAQNVIFTGLNANENGYVINVSYDATENYTDACNDTTTVKVLKATPVINVVAGSVVYPNKIVVKVKSNVAGKYSVKVGNNVANVDLAEGSVKMITFSSLAPNT